MRDFKDLTVTVESELECEILTTGNSRCYLKIGTGITKNSKPINCDKFPKITVESPFSSIRILHTVRISFIIFFVL